MAQGYTGQGQPEQGQGHITILPSFKSYTTQGRWVEASSSVYGMYTAHYNVSNAQDDQVDYWIWLSNGTYTFSLFFRKDTNYAIYTILIDGSSVGTIDSYGAASNANIATVSNISISSTGRHVLSLKAATRNASSNGWILQFHSFSMFRTV